MATLEDRRQIQKGITTDTTITVAPSNNHDDGTWSITDVYDREIALTGDSVLNASIQFRIGNIIVRVPSLDRINQLISASPGGIPEPTTTGLFARNRTSGGVNSWQDISQVESRSHVQNTDTGTTSATFIFDSGATVGIHGIAIVDDANNIDDDNAMVVTTDVEDPVDNAANLVAKQVLQTDIQKYSIEYAAGQTSVGIDLQDVFNVKAIDIYLNDNNISSFIASPSSGGKLHFDPIQVRFFTSSDGSTATLGTAYVPQAGGYSEGAIVRHNLDGIPNSVALYRSRVDTNSAASFDRANWDLFLIIDDGVDLFLHFSSDYVTNYELNWVSRQGYKVLSAPSSTDTDLAVGNRANYTGHWQMSLKSQILF